MRTSIILVVAALAISGAGCKKKTGAASMTAQPVCAPFTEMGLPTEPGVVWFCQSHAMHVVYDSADPHALGVKYEAALLAHGWVRRMPVNEKQWQWLGVYDKDTHSVTVTVEKADFSGKVPGGEQVSLAFNELPPPH